MTGRLEDTRKCWQDWKINDRKKERPIKGGKTVKLKKISLVKRVVNKTKFSIGHAKPNKAAIICNNFFFPPPLHYYVTGTVLSYYLLFQPVSCFDFQLRRVPKRTKTF